MELNQNQTEAYLCTHLNIQLYYQYYHYLLSVIR